MISIARWIKSGPGGASATVIGRDVEPAKFSINLGFSFVSQHSIALLDTKPIVMHHPKWHE